MKSISLEEQLCKDYLENAKDEVSFDRWVSFHSDKFSLILSNGFEERSLGIIKKLANSGVKVITVIIGRYTIEEKHNEKYWRTLQECVRSLEPDNLHVLENNNDGKWIIDALKLCDTINILFDITSISNRSIFSTLDNIAFAKKQIFIAYTEAGEYWPKRAEWENLRKNLKDESFEGETLSEIVDKLPWLFGYEHKLELVNGYEGYDSASSGKALLGYLPFKCARLAGILGDEEYSEIIFIAGEPRLPENHWRLSALFEINEPIIKDRNVKIIRTFSYKNALKDLLEILFSGKRPLIHRYDIHIAILGSKLQTISCWILCNYIKSITAVTSIPREYFPDAFSEGIGQSWVIQFTPPQR